MSDKINTNEQTVRANTIIEWLKNAYPDARCALDHTNALELLIATILSAQCTDERVNLVTGTLFREYQNANDYLATTAEELEADVHSTGFYRNKAKNIRATCERILRVFNGEVPNTMDELLTLPGVARKTANVVLGNWYNINSGVVVDTHVSRLSQRLGLTANSTPEKIETDLMQIVPREDWTLFSHLLIAHGRKICQARKPKCGECGLKQVCPSAFRV